MKVQAVVQDPPKKDVRKPRSENVGLDQTGAFFVDHTCIGALNLGRLLRSWFVAGLAFPISVSNSYKQTL